MGRCFDLLDQERPALRRERGEVILAEHFDGVRALRGSGVALVGEPATREGVVVVDAASGDRLGSDCCRGVMAARRVASKANSLTAPGGSAPSNHRRSST